MTYEPSVHQICNLASNCLCSCSTGTGSAGTEGDAVRVYVWGSNSSHQLAEGTLEKILQPKLAQGFSDAQMVRPGPSVYGTARTLCLRHGCQYALSNNPVSPGLVLLETVAESLRQLFD